jgi:hypothetical protein
MALFHIGILDFFSLFLNVPTFINEPNAYVYLHICESEELMTLIYHLTLCISLYQCVWVAAPIKRKGLSSDSNLHGFVLFVHLCVFLPSLILIPYCLLFSNELFLFLSPLQEKLTLLKNIHIYFSLLHKLLHLWWSRFIFPLLVSEFPYICSIR